MKSNGITPEYLRTITDVNLAKMMFSAKMIQRNTPIMDILLVEKERREEET